MEIFRMAHRAISTEAQYESALADLVDLMDAAPGSPEEQRLESLARLVEQYEQKHYPMDLFLNETRT